jgi:ClpA/ClpB-like protein
MLSPNPHYYEIRGRAAEIARTLGSPVGGAEHLFLAMLHDGGWPVSVISHLADLGQAEAAVLALISDPGYSPPAGPPLLFWRDWYVETLGAEVAFEMGDSYVGVEHAFLSMLRNRESVPARALAGLAGVAGVAGLDALEAAVLEAKNAPPGEPPQDAAFLPEGQQMDGPLRKAIIRALPEGATYGFNHGEDQRAWMTVFGADGSLGRDVAREVLSTALASLGRPPLDG